MTQAQALRPADSHLLGRLVELGIALSAETDRDRLLETLLLEAKTITHADGGTLYILDDQDCLRFEIIRNDSLGIAMGGTSGNPISFPPICLEDPETGLSNHKNIASHSVLIKDIVVVDDAYHAEGYDFSGTRAFDQNTGYRSKSFMTVPLMTPEGEVVGVLQLINAQNEAGEVIPFREDAKSVISALSGQAAIVISNRMLLDSQKELLDSFIRLIAGAIDEKSPYTGGHCQRVPEIAKRLAQAANEQTDGPFADFTMNAAEWQALHLASWLHDCGKVTTPEYVVDKATKLETICNRIHEIRTRFEVLRRDAEIKALKRELAGEDKAEIAKDLARENKALDEDFAFVAECNIGGEFMSDDKLQRLQDIAKRTMVRTFDRGLVLSWVELHRMDKDLRLHAVPAVEPVLWDRPDHKTDLYNHGELHNLSVRRGTLTDEERNKINEHVEVSIRMLENLPFPKHLRNVPEYAGSHHEKCNGLGYPRGLTAVEMSIPARMMAIADVFEALTAKDRPYKAAKTLSEAVKILWFMKKDGEIDPDLFDLFLSSGVYRDYAEVFLLPEQLDAVDISQYIG